MFFRILGTARGGGGADSMTPWVIILTATYRPPSLEDLGLA